MSKLNGIKLEKLYYSIGEVSTIFEVNASLIRFWEKEFPQIQPKKNKKGNRLFTVKDIEIFNKIYHLVKEKGFTLEGAKLEFKANKSLNMKELEVNSLVKKEIVAVDYFAATNEEVILRLQKIKQRLLALR